MKKKPWLIPFQHPGLREKEIHLWKIVLKGSFLQLENLKGIISKEEKEQAEQYAFDYNRQQYIFRRGILRCVLGRYLECSPQEITFTYNEYGKPALPEKTNPFNLRFSMSFSAELALLAVTRACAIGVDIENIKKINYLGEIIDSYFSNQEKTVFKQLQDQYKNEIFFTYWTQKEAYIKARGEGLAYPLDAFSVNWLSENDCRWMHVISHTDESRKWFLKGIQPAAGYIAAIAAETSECHIRQWQWVF